MAIVSLSRATGARKSDQARIVNHDLFFEPDAWYVVDVDVKTGRAFTYSEFAYMAADGKSLVLPEMALEQMYQLVRDDE